jgi:hypothetical protein
LDTRAANSVNDEGIEGGAGSGMAQLYPMGQQFSPDRADSTL